MPDSGTIGWLITNFSIAALALILLDRSHRDARAKLEETYKAYLAEKQERIDSQKRNIELINDQLAVKRGEHERI